MYVYMCMYMYVCVYIYIYRERGREIERERERERYRAATPGRREAGRHEHAWEEFGLPESTPRTKLGHV